MRIQVFLILLLFSSIFSAVAQDAAHVYGTVLDENDNPLPGVHVYILNFQLQGTASDSAGYYELRVPSGRPISLVYTFIGFKEQKTNIQLDKGEHYQQNITISLKAIELEDVTIQDRRIREQASVVRIDVENIPYLPGQGGVEAALQAQALGVASNNELSSTYSVRGGNFDENLVYINDFEVYRPFLIRSGQQEGLSVINPDMVKSILFSSGGFEARYGDKMASVLDIEYKKPEEFGGSVTASMLGGGVHLEGALKERFTYLLGLRYKSNQYLLSSLQTKGMYNPSFLDMQAYFTYKLRPTWELELISNIASNRYHFIPVERQTTFGVVNNVLRLTVYFEGQEYDTYNNLMAGFAATNRPHPELKLKWLTSIYRTVENESFDILGEYWLNEIESDFGKDDFGQVRSNRGVGGVHNFTRNRLEALITNVGHRGGFIRGDHHFQWGLNYKHEIINDQIKEWELLDSAGYSLPYNTSEVLLSNVLKTKIDLATNRYEAFLQDTWMLGEQQDFILTGGTRFHYWDLNKEFLVSPRAQIAFTPDWEKDVVIRAAAGFYHQPPFYRELRDFDGKINPDLKSQKSYHFVVGGDMNFNWGDRKFKFITELYYKYLRDLVPYQFDNVLIRYFGENLADGYVAGIDFRLYGEFVKDTESWISMSMMKTAENLRNDSYEVHYDAEGNIIYNTTLYAAQIVRVDTVYPGNIPRPTDQRVNFAMFFQDYLPRNENFKMHLNLLFGTGLPFGPPDRQRHTDILRIPPYRRVDIGFSALLFDRERREELPKNPIKHFETIWATLEIYNLLGVQNTVSYFWVKDITNTTYAVPNYLTARRINGRIILKF